MVLTTFGVVELRRYAMRPGKCGDLLSLFEREFLETQEACGMVPFAHYRDINDADTFVWLRGFEAMETRREALDAFYVQSQAWREHREAANATIVDSDNVLLLREARPGSGFDTKGYERPLPGSPEAGSFAVVAVFMLDAAAKEPLLASFEREMLPELRAIASRVAYYVTEERPNDFPKLPVREGESAFVVAGIVPNRESLETWSAAFDTQHLPTALATATIRFEEHRLEPGARSLLR